MIKYDWHDDKRLINIEKHGIDFIRAAEVYESPLKVTLQSPRDEARLVDIAPVNGRFRVLVYMIRADVVWVISYRKAKLPKEEKIYHLSRLEK